MEQNEASWLQAIAVRRHVGVDAVVVVPGIMGSELEDASTGRTLWGLRRLSWYVKAWTKGDGLAELALTEDELSGRTERVRAVGLLRFPAFAPFLAGVEPYTPLVKSVREVMSHPDSVLEFAYDWRLPVAHNARLLAAAAGDHLERWRARSGRADARLVFVAHSMGGLLCRAMPADSGLNDVIEATITIGTPFDGAAKAAVILGSGAGAPLPSRRLRKLASTMPGVHDLLPVYRCVDEGGDARRLTPGDVASFGGSAELAAATFAMHEARRPMVAHRALVGVAQATCSSIELADGVVTGFEHTFRPAPDGGLERAKNGLLQRFHGYGDGTVPRNSAKPELEDFERLPQQHGALARSPETISYVRDVLRHALADRGDRLGGGDDEDGVGLELPDCVAAGTSWHAVISGTTPQQARCVVKNAETNAVIDHPRLMGCQDGGTVLARTTLPTPGLYRVEVSSGGTSPVSQLVLAAEPTTV